MNCQILFSRKKLEKIIISLLSSEFVHTKKRQTPFCLLRSYSEPATIPDGNGLFSYVYVHADHTSKKSAVE